MKLQQRFIWESSSDFALVCTWHVNIIDDVRQIGESCYQNSIANFYQMKIGTRRTFVNKVRKGLGDMDPTFVSEE
jgi:hypothetical protein